MSEIKFVLMYTLKRYNQIIRNNYSIIKSKSFNSTIISMKCSKPWDTL